MTLQRLEHGAYIHTADPGEPGYSGNPKRISVTEEEGRLLAALAIGKTVLEIGTGLGVSACYMCIAAHKVFTCDTDPWVIDLFSPPAENVEFVQRSTLERLGELPGSRMISMVFIDGLHTEAAVCADIELARKVIQKRFGLIVMHDSNMSPVREIIRQARLKPIIEFDTYYGLGVYEP